MKTRSADATLIVKDVNVKIKDTQILSNVNVHSRSGDLLAVMGPTGSGKTTLLNVIAGRQTIESGSVTLNGNVFNKRARRRLAFVLQQDVFLPRLTLWETLYFTAMITIPESVPHEEKLQRINDLVDLLDMRKCLHTIIGDLLNRGLSGGEKKRASIACELLTDPDIMILDEPTSGLDSSTAYTLLDLLKNYTTKFNKIMVVTIHQPSSQMYKMFSNLLLLVNGHEGYFGPAELALDYFADIGLTCDLHYNPADFLLEIVKSDKETVEQIISAAKGSRDRYHLTSDKANSLPDCNGVNKSAPYREIKGDSKVFTDVTSTETYGNSTFTPVQLELDADETTMLQFEYDGTNSDHSKQHRGKWPTKFITQYRLLTWRNFKQSKGALLHTYDISRIVILSIICGVTYFQMEKEPATMRDRMGLLFFVIIFWNFQAALDAIITFPVERGVVCKERSAGAYRLSAYYLAKMTSELPLVLIQPTLMYIFVYWMAGLGGFEDFIWTLLIFLVSTLGAQGLGLAIGAVTMDLKLALTVFSTYMLFGLLLGGFYSQRIPSWLKWAQYLSMCIYPFTASCILIFDDMGPIFCNQTGLQTVPQCEKNTSTVIYFDDILQNMSLNLPLSCSVSTMCILLVLFRVLGYFVLRFKHHTLK